MRLINAANARAVGVMISLDRQERGQGNLSAVQEVEQVHGIPVHSIITLADIQTYLVEIGKHERELAAIKSYRLEYGV